VGHGPGPTLDIIPRQTTERGGPFNLPPFGGSGNEAGEGRGGGMEKEKKWVVSFRQSGVSRRGRSAETVSIRLTCC